MSLRYRTKIDKSGIEGVGCFTIENIKKGSIVWKRNSDIDIVIKDANIKTMSKAEQEFIREYAVKRCGNWELYSDHTHFINHSRDPNIADVDEDTTIALRDIKAGEELLIDYRTFKDDPIIEENWI